MIKQDYSKDDSSVELTDHPERIFGCSVFWAVLVCVISGYAFGLAVFGG